MFAVIESDLVSRTSYQTIRNCVSFKLYSVENEGTVLNHRHTNIEHISYSMHVPTAQIYINVSIFQFYGVESHASHKCMCLCMHTLGVYVSHKAVR